MYIDKTDLTTFDARQAPTAAVPAMGFTEADHAMAYAKEIFKRLTGYPAEGRYDHDHRLADGDQCGDRGAQRAHMPGTEAAHATGYAEEIFARMRGHRPEHHNRDCRLEYGVADGDHVAGRGRIASMNVERAMAYAEDLFKRLRGFPAQGLLGPNFARNLPHQRQRRRENGFGARLRCVRRRYPNFALTARTEASSVDTPFPIANAISRAMASLARPIRRSVLEPYVRGLFGPTANRRRHHRFHDQTAVTRHQRQALRPAGRDIHHGQRLDEGARNADAAVRNHVYLTEPRRRVAPVVEGAGRHLAPDCRVEADTPTATARRSDLHVGQHPINGRCAHRQKQSALFARRPQPATLLER